jgi:UDP:flavonoid glycosyltransferase YjiC (YdhE family)
VRAVITNFGSTGDIVPFVALARELQHQGHVPVLALSPNLSDWAERYGLEFYPVGPDLQEAQQAINLVDLTRHIGTNSIEERRSLIEQTDLALPQAVNDLRIACSNADVLIAGNDQPASRIVHEITGINFVSVQVEHFGLEPSPEQKQVLASLYEPFLIELGLTPLAARIDKDARSSQMVLFAMSSHVCAPPDNWPKHYHMTGFFFLDDIEAQPDAELVEFLAAGEPPIVISFGSIVHADKNALEGILIEAIRLSGYRAIIQRGWSGLAIRELPPNIYPVDYVSHFWLFPQAACVVHHGGAGTLAAAIRAGVPSIIIPHSADQPLWAKDVHSIGYTVPPIFIQHLSADRLGLSIAVTLATPRFRTEAQKLSSQIKAEQGTKKAVQLIEQLIG